MKRFTFVAVVLAAAILTPPSFASPNSPGATLTGEGTTSEAAVKTDAAGEPLGGMQLLSGYRHQRLQGIDSIVGEIVKNRGLKISYEIGRVSKPGQPRTGGGFTDRPQKMPKQNVQWYREQTINGQPMHMAYSKDDTLLVSFPEKGLNFRANIQSTEQLADAMLMILTYPEPNPGAATNKDDNKMNSDVQIKQNGQWEPTTLPLAGLAEGKIVEVKVRGTLQTGLMAIGGETTGTIIRFGKTTWELDLRNKPAFGPIAEKLNGKPVVVTGRVGTKAGIEIAKRTILTIDSINPADD